MIVRQYHSWVDADTKDNSAATATKAAGGTGISHYITSVAGSFNKTAADNNLVLKDGSTEIARWVVPDQNTLHIEFPSPIQLSPNTAANLVLDASGAAGTSGTAVLTGYTV